MKIEFFTGLTGNQRWEGKWYFCPVTWLSFTDLIIEFPHKRSKVSAVRMGSGEKLLLCFHGFGEDAEKFKVVEPALSYNYTMIAIDLPFHGQTKWQRDEFFMKADLKWLIEEILQHENKNRFSMMGYSLGGKIVLAAVDLFPALIDEIILVAPDGVKTNAWYNLAVYPGWGRKLFRRFISKPQFVFSTARFLKSLGLLNKRFYKFLAIQTNTEAKRQQVYDVWMTIKDFETSLHHTKALLNHYAIKSFIFIGKYDRVITMEIGSKFAKGLNHCRCIILEKGHNLITESFNEPLKRTLQG